MEHSLNSTDIFVVPIEPIHTRYTGQWYDSIPNLIREYGQQNNIQTNVIVIDGSQVPPRPSPGAFLDWGATNIYKSSQLIKIAELFRTGGIKPNSKFLITDAWNPCILQIKYMSELMHIPVTIHGLLHAGSWDSFDYLGREIKDKAWVRSLEASMFYACDHVWFATQFHIDLFVKELFGFENHVDFSIHNYLAAKRIHQTGWPLPHLSDLKPSLTKKPIIVFPHRIAPEKQLDIFRDLSASLPQFEWIVCQEKELTKQEYHQILADSVLTFSANLQETFGISMVEATWSKSIPLVPDRLSYREMYGDIWKYPSEWTLDWNAYQQNKSNLVNDINEMATWALNSPNQVDQLLEQQKNKLNSFVDFEPLLKNLLA